MKHLLTIREDHDDYSHGLLSTIYYSKEALPHGVVPFGYEATGDLICFDFNSALGTIYTSSNNTA
jgi:hypothetical protein